MKDLVSLAEPGLHLIKDRLKLDRLNTRVLFFFNIWLLRMRRVKIWQVLHRNSTAKKLESDFDYLIFISVLAWQHLARVKGTEVLSGGGMVDVPPRLSHYLLCNASFPSFPSVHVNLCKGWEQDNLTVILFFYYGRIQHKI